MAFRIAEALVRGMVDNRAKGKVLGQIWLEGRPDPLVLELKGNAWPDLAGCALTFTNKLKPVNDPSLHALATSQRGTIGDLTASRKVRVYDVPVSEAYAMSKRGEKPPEHMANCVYLEWFSQANGRVVIESPDLELVISAPEWRMSPEENQDRARLASQGMADFMGRAAGALQAEADSDEDEQRMNEHDFEKFFKDCDVRTAKFDELMKTHRNLPEGWDS